MPEKATSVFKRCMCCGHAWADRDDMLSDRSVSLVGYQVNFQVLELGYFLFDHEDCGSTVSLPVERFLDLHAGPVYQERRTGEEDCPGYCLHRDELERCPARCECAYIRDLLQIIRRWPKRPCHP